MITIKHNGVVHNNRIVCFPDWQGFVLWCKLNFAQFLLIYLLEIRLKIDKNFAILLSPNLVGRSSTAYNSGANDYCIMSSGVGRSLVSRLQSYSPGKKCATILSTFYGNEILCIYQYWRVWNVNGNNDCDSALEQIFIIFVETTWPLVIKFGVTIFFLCDRPKVTIMSVHHCWNPTWITIIQLRRTQLAA